MKLNNIYLGDCYELIKQVPDNSIDLIITDPPYEFSAGGFNDSKKGLDKYLNQLKSTDLVFGVDMSILDEFVRVMKKIYLYVWCSREQIPNYIDYFVKEKSCNFEIIIWNKSNALPYTSGHYLKDKEYCLLFWEKGCKIKGDYTTLKTVYVTQINTEDKKKYNHPTIKPLPIIKNFILNSTEENDIVFDPFVGSGTTCKAAKDLGRQYLGFEINKEYYDIANSRLNEVITSRDIIRETQMLNTRQYKGWL